jgi:hypothetical protein
MAYARSFVVACVALALGAGPLQAAATYSLRARGAQATGLIRLLADLERQKTVIGPSVNGTLRLEVKGDSISILEDQVVRASGASSLVLGHFVLIDAPDRIEAAKVHPVRRLLERGGYEARRVTVDFTQIDLVRVFRMLAEVTKRPFEVGDGVDTQVTVIARDVPWNELLDALVVAGDLTRVPVDRSIRISRRGDRTPRFSPVPGLNDGVPADATAAQPRRPSRCQTPLGRFELSELKLVAVVTGLEDPAALVRMPDGSEYAVRRGNCIGNAGGVARRIDRDRVAVEEFEVEHADGNQGPVESVLELDGE